MTLTTPRLALPYPQSFDTDNVPASMLALATALDNKMLGFTQGTLASRPVGGSVYGKTYWATDTSLLYQYLPADANNTAGWRTIGAMPSKPTARWYGATQQILGGMLGNDPQVQQKLGWGYGPGSRAANTWPNYFDGAVWTGQGWGPGPNPSVPVPGCYRVHGQVSFLHVSPYGGPGSYPATSDYRMMTESYLVWVYRGDGVSAGGASIAFYQVADQWCGAPSYPLQGYPTVPFDCLVDLDMSDAQHSCITVWVASSAVPTIAGQVAQQVNGGSEATFLEMDYMCAI